MSEFKDEPANLNATPDDSRLSDRLVRVAERAIETTLDGFPRGEWAPEAKNATVAVLRELAEIDREHPYCGFLAEDYESIADEIEEGS